MKKSPNPKLALSQKNLLSLHSQDLSIYTLNIALCLPALGYFFGD
jgi:hypothetical protein